MNKQRWFIVAAAVVSSVGTYLCVKGYYEQLANDVIAEVRMANAEKEPPEVEVVLEKEPEPRQPHRNVDNKFERLSDFESTVRKYNPAVGEEIRIVKPEESVGPDCDCELISVNVYYDDESYEKGSASWYRRDDVICSFEGEIIEGNRFSGVEWRPLLSKMEPGDSVYIRDHKRRIDYEIDLIEGFYGRDVAGFDPEEEEYRDDPLRSARKG